MTSLTKIYFKWVCENLKYEKNLQNTLIQPIRLNALMVILPQGKA